MTCGNAKNPIASVEESVGYFKERWGEVKKEEEKLNDSWTGVVDLVGKLWNYERICKLFWARFNDNYYGKCVGN